MSAASAAAQTPVIVISIDTLRADRLSARTPHINAFASNGTAFTAAQTQIPLTLPAHTVLFTSTYPFANGVEENAGTVPPGAITLASVMRSHGYKTAAFIGSIFLEKQLGLDRGFDTYDSPFDFEAFSKLSGEMLSGGTAQGSTPRERRPGALVLRAANQWLSAHKAEPIFLFVHLFDMHKPYRTSSYDTQLQQVDQLMGGFRQSLQREGWWDRSLVIFLSDHGEGLGDHGESDHGYFIYESTLHVPLLIHWPLGTTRFPARIDTPVGLIDVAPSILDFLKLPAAPSFKGRSFLDTTRLDAKAQPVIAESVYARDCFGWAPLRSLRLGAWKYIDSPKPELYDLGKDSGEKINVVRTNPRQAAQMKEQLQLPGGTPRATANPDPQRSKAVLESLGYIAPGPRGSAHTADPKDKLPELLAYEDALTLLSQRRTGEAIAALRNILRADPGNLLARRDLGVALLESKDFRQARVELQKVAATSPDDYVTRYALGVANESLGLLPEAREQYEAACRAAPAAQCKAAIRRLVDGPHLP